MREITGPVEPLSVDVTIRLHALRLAVALRGDSQTRLGATDTAHTIDDARLFADWIVNGDRPEPKRIATSTVATNRTHLTPDDIATATT